MRIEIKLDGGCKETTVIVVTDEVTDEINALVKRISAEEAQEIAGFCGGELKLLKQDEIYRLYSEDGKIFAETKDGKYRVRNRLYELEEKLDKARFVRISNSEIINLKKVKKFDLSYTGTICVLFLNGSKSYASRRYVSKIKHTLKM